MTSLANRVAVVTGSARDRSIGGGIARVCSRATEPTSWSTTSA
jgi:enoyl-[acyl-carrier-protein] reductase (NADH)